MSTSNQPETPAQELARRIVERLIREGLIRPEAARQIQPKLANGKLRAEDWRLPIELASSKEDEQ